MHRLDQRGRAVLEIVDHRANFLWAEQLVADFEQLLVGVGGNDSRGIDAEEPFGDRVIAHCRVDPQRGAVEAGIARRLAGQAVIGAHVAGVDGEQPRGLGRTLRNRQPAEQHAVIIGVKVERGKRLKMSLQDLKDENKQSEGSPEMKLARRQRQRDLARGSVAKAMKDAQFVVVNPMHFAVALTYDPALAPAPVVLAKGRGETALAMRELAGEAGLPVLHYPQLARALYFTTRTNQMVREELYIAIAALVAFVLSLKRGERPKMPRVEVPAPLRFDAEGKPEKAA